MADKKKIEEAIERRILKAVDEDLDPEAVQNLEHKIVTLRQLASDE